MAAAGVLPTIEAWRQVKRELAELRREYRNLQRRLRRADKRGHRPASMAIRMYVGKATGNIAQGASGTVTVWAGPAGSEEATNRTITNCYNRTEITVTSGDWCIVTILGPRRRYVEPWTCP